MSAMLMDFETIDDEWEDFEDWSQNPPHLKRMRGAHQSYRKMWDGIKKAEYEPTDPSVMPMKQTIINELRREYPGDQGAQDGRPLGNFKDVMGLSLEGIYNYLADQMRKPRRNKDGDKVSYLDSMYHHTSWLWDNYFKDEAKWNNWNLREYSQGVSIMLYSSSRGILLENRTHNALEKWLAGQPKASKLFTYERAEADEWESKDVDGIFRVKATGKVAVKVSIKCNRALDKEWIDRVYRKGKKKLAPDIYIGYHLMEDTKLDQITFNRKNLKQQLKEALSGSSTRA